ncbi:SusC/RagA family TonB-linked outer membrane protein [Chitinophaga nivalis]|uniref:SusC/RagA family TonB-linked outer membrane protein n=1 Tax=Chitinophaga nivalis TaxID=2991709 RepID=A0ABT3IFR6_9BACT|nr:SusC/RagA family TonB-linked outer membrane protein [Chitinophaga nivalis]MCW3467504.1 SusC/RagA family TonB-linked outer membrane protein [Chitinophaga nivalis]MCW3482804.1 SusC/RagA family TonB-linked outer membrane protein [Chitinophaga nivalis]
MRRSLLLATLLFLCCCVTAWAQDKKALTGTVKDEKGTLLPGVTVKEKGAANGAMTAADGSFKINVAPNATLIFSYIGFLNQEVPLNGQSVLQIVLKEDNKNLSEVVVTAMGIKKQSKALGYSVSTVSAKQLTQAGATNFASALYGKAAGVKIQTAPGGATSAVSVSIRGVNSLTGNQQPLYIVDGIPIRNGGANTENYWDQPRIMGNGIVDINPEDIESLTVLKGASASALYGSEAANGVVVITTKGGAHKKGLGVDVNTNYTVEKVAFTPKFQNTYGPGYDYETAVGRGFAETGFRKETYKGQTYERADYSAYGNFGAIMDGRPLLWWDGQVRNYDPQPNNYKKMFRTGYNWNGSVAISNASEMGSFRFAYTRTQYEGVQRGGKQGKNIFNFNGTLKLHKKVTADVMVNYINSNTLNRPVQLRNLSTFDGLNRSEKTDILFDRFKTSEGYQFVTVGNRNRNPNEAFIFNNKGTAFMSDVLWRQTYDNYEEKMDRVIGSFTLNYSILDNLKLRGRVGTDLTSEYIEDRQHNLYSTAFGGSGVFGAYNNKYNTVYGDVLLTYTQKLAKDWDLTVNAGAQGRKELYRRASEVTQGGLILENWFSLNNTTGVVKSILARQELRKAAFFATASINFRNYWFLEATSRKEYASTLPPGGNSFFYPSFNSSFVFTEAFHLPEVLSYGKLRASFGMVGNEPTVYDAYIGYDQKQVSGVPTHSAGEKLGNNQIKSERKTETEIGLETKWLKNRLSVDVTFYTNKITDQIINLTTPMTSGVISKLVNVGDLKNTGWEFAINARPLADKSPLYWNIGLNAGANKNKVIRLMDGVDFLSLKDEDNGALRIVAAPGQAFGDIYVNERLRDQNGRLVISADGIWERDNTKQTKVGNMLPKIAGGLSNNFTYKNFNLDILVDFRWGGDLASLTNYYGMGKGELKESMQYRDEANGGLPYYIVKGADGSYNNVRLPNHNATAPNGERVFHDGVVLDGVTADGKTNEKLISAASYYLNTFSWGDAGRYDQAVYKNNYIKLREVSLGYTLPKKTVGKIGFQSINVSLIGRNLLYFYKSLPNIDPEAAIGTQMSTQGIEYGTTPATRSFGAAIRASF